MSSSQQYAGLVTVTDDDVPRHYGSVCNSRPLSSTGCHQWIQS